VGIIYSQVLLQLVFSSYPRFQGHTSALTLLNFAINEYSPWRMKWLHILCWILNVFGMFFILAAKEHYTIDVLIAFLISSRLWVFYHAMCNETSPLGRAGFTTAFPVFSYLESYTDGILPNEYENPITSEWLYSWVSPIPRQAGKRKCVGEERNKEEIEKVKETEGSNGEKQQYTTIS